MSSKLRRLRNRDDEIFVTIVCFLAAFGLVFWALGFEKPPRLVQLGEKFGFSLWVALFVRWILVWFSEPYDEDSDKSEYYEALRSAKHRLWIHQTWLPGVEGEAAEILGSEASEIRILLASFKPKSPIYARIAGRKILEDDAKTFVKNSAQLFVERQNADTRRKVSLKFSFGHHPSWIAIIDPHVFWGPTPIDADNHSLQYLFHKLRASKVPSTTTIPKTKGEFWPRQFTLLWENHSHDLGTEMMYNEKLRELDPTMWMSVQAEMKRAETD